MSATLSRCGCTTSAWPTKLTCTTYRIWFEHCISALFLSWQGVIIVWCCCVGCAVTARFDGWTLQELGAGTIYKNLRLASTRVDWTWVGGVHEYVRRKDGGTNTQHELQGYWLTHDASGGKGGSRYEQDAIILTKVCLWVACREGTKLWLANLPGPFTASFVTTYAWCPLL